MFRDHQGHDTGRPVLCDACNDIFRHQIAYLFPEKIGTVCPQRADDIAFRYDALDLSSIAADHKSADVFFREPVQRLVEAGIDDFSICHALPYNTAPTVDAIDDSGSHWTMETVSFDATYNGQRMLAQVFLPKNIDPPYQVVMYFSSSAAILRRSSDELEIDFIDFIIKSGRAVVLPVL